MERIYIDAPGEGEFVVPPTSLGLVLVTHEEKSGGVWYQRSSVLIAASAGTVIPYSIDAGRLCFGVVEMESETRLFEYGNPGPGARQDWTVLWDPRQFVSAPTMQRPRPQTYVQSPAASLKQSRLFSCATMESLLVE